MRTVGGQSIDFSEGSVTYRGVEAEATRTIGFGLGFYGSGSVNQARQSGGVDGVCGSAPTTPQATLSTGLILDRDGIDASLIDRWTGGSYGDVGDTQWIAPYNQLDLSAGTTFRFERAAPLTLRMQIFNLLDSRKIDGPAGYTVADATPLFWTQTGRSVFLSATAKF